MTLRKQSNDELIQFAVDKNIGTAASGDVWKVLIADDEDDVHEVTRFALNDVEFEGKRIEFVSVYSGKEAMTLLGENSEIALILLDVVMETEDAGLRVVQHIRNTLGNRIVRIILRTGHPGKSPERNVIVDYDINDYKEKTELTTAKLFASVITSLREYQHLSEVQAVKEDIEKENESLKTYLNWSDLKHPEVFSKIKTKNLNMLSLFRYIEITATSSRSVLISGETGVGKELVAQVIHELSDRKGEMVTVNVGGLDDNLFSDTLFGHEKGAYTGAERPRSGLIEKAAGGTLFLDEIGDLGSESQVKLLRLLQNKQYYKLGSDVKRQSDTRIIVATHHDLAERAMDGKFRQDLFYRLSTHHIHIPPLRERRDDVMLLLEYFVDSASVELGRTSPAVPNQLQPLLEGYDFPGNIRELESMVFDAVNQTTTDVLDLSVFRNKLSIPGEKTIPKHQFSNNRTFKMTFPIQRNFPTMNEVTDQLITMALDEANGNQTVAAQLLGISRQALNYKVKKIKGR